MVAVTGSGTTELKEKNHVPYIQFKNLSATGIVKHGFSTRKGGVSTGIFSSMNLNFKRGDDPDAVMENYRRMAAALNMRVEDMRIVCPFISLIRLEKPSVCLIQAGRERLVISDRRPFGRCMRSMAPSRRISL